MLIYRIRWFSKKMKKLSLIKNHFRNKKQLTFKMMTFKLQPRIRINSSWGKKNSRRCCQAKVKNLNQVIFLKHLKKIYTQLHLHILLTELSLIRLRVQLLHLKQLALGKQLNFLNDRTFF